jgi:hypothetical protein
LRARTIPLVLPRAHDCMTLFFGSKERYLEYFHARPGVYFKTSGWMERSGIGEDLKQLTIPHQMGMDSSYAELVEKYGEDDAQYLWDELCNTVKHYGQYTFIEMGVEPDDRFEQQTRRDAEARSWKFEKVQGDLALIRRLVDGPWDEREFLVVPPGHKVVARYDEGIVTSEPVADAVAPARPGDAS